MKISERDSPHNRRELPAYKRIANTPSSHAGRKLVRQLLDHFQIVGSKGEHTCFVHPPLAFCVETMEGTWPNKQFSPDFVRFILRHVILALDHLHSEAKIIHAGEYLDLLVVFDVTNRGRH